MTAAAAAILAFWPTWPGALVAAVVPGLGFGVYLGGYPALYLSVAAVTILGSVLVTKIRNVS